MKFPFEPRRQEPERDNALSLYLASHPTCERCGEPSVLVDHVIPHHGDDGLIFMRENMRAVCRACHSLLQDEERSPC